MTFKEIRGYFEWFNNVEQVVINITIKPCDSRLHKLKMHMVILPIYALNQKIQEQFRRLASQIESDASANNKQHKCLSPGDRSRVGGWCPIAHNSLVQKGVK